MSENHDATQDVGIHPADDRRGGLPNLAIVAIILAAIALTLGLFKDLQSIIAPTFLAMNLLIAAYPLYGLMVKARIPKMVAAVTTGLAVFVVVIVGLGAVGWSVTEMVQTLTGYSDQFRNLYEQGIALLAQLGFDQESLMNQLQSISPTSVLGVAGSILSNASAASGIVVVIAIAIVFLVMDMPSMGQRLGLTHRLHPTLTDSIGSLVVGIRRYWVVTTVFGLIVAVLDFFVLILVGVPLPLVWAVLSFITNYIPNIGFIIGVVPPALLALFEKGPVAALIVVIAYSVLNFVIQSIIQPKFTGESVGVTPFISFLSLLFWYWVLGALGALLALPATLLLKAFLVDADPKARWVNAFISNDPKTTAGAGTPRRRRTTSSALGSTEIDAKLEG